ncbi:hypothetical protein E4U41_003108 [Claviceps citrina]|nr:hypothetical protein E4U41_003108 [Claviceps citrina]
MENTAAATEKHSPSHHVLKTPVWVTVVRGFQVFFSLVILALAGTLMHDLYLDEFGFAVATSILTWVIVFYAITTEKITSWQKAYHVVAVLALEAFLVVLWLATFAAAAARRATFVVPVSVSSCYDDGSAINSKTCAWKRALELERRDILFKSGKAMFSAIAGLGALVWLLSIATFVYTLVMFLRGRKEGRFPIGYGVSDGTEPTYQMGPKTEQTAPMMATQQQQQKQQQQQPIQPQHTSDYQPTPVSQHSPQSPYQQHQQHSAFQTPQDQSVYNTQYPQQYQPESGYQHHVYQGSAQSGTHQPAQQHSSPPPTTPSPAPGL